MYLQAGIGAAQSQVTPGRNRLSVL